LVAARNTDAQSVMSEAVPTSVIDPSAAVLPDRYDVSLLTVRAP
jgi:hypothetical protein